MGLAKVRAVYAGRFAERPEINRNFVLDHDCVDGSSDALGGPAHCRSILVDVGQHAEFIGREYECRTIAVPNDSLYLYCPVGIPGHIAIVIQGSWGCVVEPR